MHLYVLVYEYDDVNDGSEWAHFVSDKTSFTYDEQLAMAKDFSLREGIDATISNVWLNHVDTVDGYKITLTKEEA